MLILYILILLGSNAFFAYLGLRKGMTYILKCYHDMQYQFYMRLSNGDIEGALEHSSDALELLHQYIHTHGKEDTHTDKKENAACATENQN